MLFPPRSAGAERSSFHNNRPLDRSASKKLAAAVRMTLGAWVENLEERKLFAATTPYHGSPFSIPGAIQFEDFDNGPSGVAYSDRDTANQGGQYRDTPVDIALSGDAADGAKGYAVGYVKGTEWTLYTAQVKTSGYYDVAFRVSNPGTGAKFHVELDSAANNLTGAITIPPTATWTAYETITKAHVYMPAGVHTLKVVYDTFGSLQGAVGNFNWMSFAPSGTSIPTPPPVLAPPVVPPVAVPPAIPPTVPPVVPPTVPPVVPPTVPPTPVAAPPQNVLASDSAFADKVHVTWSAAEGATSYQVFRSQSTNPATALAIGAPTTATSFDDATVAPGVTYYYWVESINKTGASAPSSNNDGSSTPQVATPLPGRIQAEAFDNGPDGIGYHDLEAGNLGGANIRSGGVDIAASHDPSDPNGSGYALSYTKAGEWLKYTTNVAQDGNYDIGFRVANPVAGAMFHLEVDGTNVTGSMVVPNTGGWDTWQTITKSAVALKAGPHVFKLVLDTNASNGFSANINWIDVTSNVPVAPTIGSLTDKPDPVLRGSDVTLTANTVSNNATSVSFYRESNGTPGLQADDTLISTDSTRNDGFTATISTTGLPLGAMTLYAQATDSASSLIGAAVTATSTINPVVPLIGSLSADPAGIIVGSNAPITLIAKKVTDTAASITGVSFYLESNGTPGLQPGSDTLISTATTPDASASDTYTANVATDGFDVGVTTFYAQATDSAGQSSTTSTTSATISPVPTPPSNDNFANTDNLNASVLPNIKTTNATSIVAEVTGSNVLATKEDGEPDHAGSAASHSVWYAWTAPGTGEFSVSTAGSTFDTVLAVYTGSNLDDLTPVAANDNASDNVKTSALTFNANSGITYEIAVDGVAGATGDIALAITPVVPPVVVPPPPPASPPPPVSPPLRYRRHPPRPSQR